MEQTKPELIVTSMNGCAVIPGIYYVLSSKGDDRYRVDVMNNTCTCVGYFYHANKKKKGGNTAELVKYKCRHLKDSIKFHNQLKEMQQHDNNN